MARRLTFAQRKLRAEAQRFLGLMRREVLELLAVLIALAVAEALLPSPRYVGRVITGVDCCSPDAWAENRPTVRSARPAVTAYSTNESRYPGPDVPRRHGGPDVAVMTQCGTRSQP